MGSISQYAQAKDYTLIEPDVYPATITHAEVVMENGKAKIDQYGKARLLLKVHLDDETDDAGGPIELRRSIAISYGRNNASGTYAALATLVEAAMGIPCGDKSQPHVTTEELVGQKIRCQTANVEKDGKVYTNIVGFLAPKKPREAIRAMLQDEAPGLDDELPF